MCLYFGATPLTNSLRPKVYASLHGGLCETVSLHGSVLHFHCYETCDHKVYGLRQLSVFLFAFHGSPGVVSRVPCSEVLVCSPVTVIKHLPKAVKGRTGFFSLVVPGSVLSLWERHRSRSWGAGPMATTVTWGEQGTHARSCSILVLPSPV